MMETNPAELLSFNVTKLHADLDFSLPRENITIGHRFNFYLHSDPDNGTVLIRSETNAVGKSDHEFQYACQMDAIFSYKEKPDDLTAWVKAQCYPAMQRKAEDIFAAVLSALSKNVDRS